MSLARRECHKRLYLRVFNARFKIGLQEFADIRIMLHFFSKDIGFGERKDAKSQRLFLNAECTNDTKFSVRRETRINAVLMWNL